MINDDFIQELCSSLDRCLMPFKVVFAAKSIPTVILSMKIQGHKCHTVNYVNEFILCVRYASDIDIGARHAKLV